MSGSIFMFAAMIAICGAILSGYFGCYQFSRKTVTTSIIATIVLFLFFFGCALRYYNFKHMAMSLKYDKIVVLDIVTNVETQEDKIKHINKMLENGYELVLREDRSEIIGCKCTGHYIKNYSTMFFAKTIEENTRKSYEDLVNSAN